MQTVFITGSAGFIGYHLAKAMLSEGFKVIGLDSMNDYYDISLKQARHERLKHENFTAIIGRIEESGLILDIFDEYRPDYVIHLAAQAGVRFSIENPRSYLESNIVGTFELLEAARVFRPLHMLLASTSSAFGANTEMPYTESMRTDHQVSFYAATKKSTESMAHSYAHLFELPITMFRFFTVYGPWGRPDMALFKFTKAVLEEKPIDVYNYGDMKRDFTYADDLVRAIVLLISVVPSKPINGNVAIGDSLSPVAPFRVVNIGNSEPVHLTQFIEAIELALDRKAKQNFLPMQPGDVICTWADTSLLKSLTGYTPETSVVDGVAAFVEWYQDFYHSSECTSRELND